MNLTYSTSPDMWRAVWRLADAWSEAPLVKAYAASLPRNQPRENRGDRAMGVPALLQHLDSTVGPMMKPLMLGSRVPVLLGQPLISQGAPAIDQSEVEAWALIANRIEAAHRATLAWLRSRIAGFPILRAPQLAPGTSLTTFEVTTHYTWTKQELMSGLDRLPAPPGVPTLLDADSPLSTELDRAARDLVNALEESPAWNRFRTSLKELDEDAKAALRAARRELKERLAEDVVDAHEERLAWPRAEYRHHTTHAVIDSLTGSAREHADAFGEVHDLLTLVACDVLGELALFGEPWPVSAVNVEIPQPGQPIVAFELQGVAGIFVTTGQVLWLVDELMPDAVRIERLSMSWDVQGSSHKFEAQVLVGTGEAWPASMVPLSGGSDSERPTSRPPERRTR